MFLLSRAESGQNANLPINRLAGGIYWKRFGSGSIGKGKGLYSINIEGVYK